MGVAAGLVTIAAIAIAGAISSSRRRADRRGLAWGSAHPRRGDEDQIARYHRLLVERDPHVASSSVGDQEWHDLGMDDVFAELDRSSSAPGQQRLYHRLRTPARTPDGFAALGGFELLVRRFSDDASARKRVQAALGRLEDSAAYALPRLFLAQLPSMPRHAWLFAPLCLAPFLAFAAALAGFQYGWQLLLALLALNFGVRSLLAADLAWIIEPFRALHTMLEVADRLRRDESLQDASVASALAQLALLKRATSFISVVGGGNEVLRVAAEYLNMIFLIDLNAFSLARAECDRRREPIRQVFDAVGDLDSALAIASYRAGRSEWCRPVILPDGGVEVMGLTHPLLHNPRSNDLHITPAHGIVITGSNMSGKSTLLRALGVNVILAQSIHTCAATRFACPPLEVRTAISLSDDMLAGRSFYLTEATTVLGMVQADSTVQHLFLLDELFHGTNTVERIAGGVAVMEALVRGRNMAVVATHDREVVELVSDAYQPWHFAESVTGDGFAFDYRLRAGPTTQRNAIALLQALGAPDELIQRAMEICASIEAVPVGPTTPSQC